MFRQSARPTYRVYRTFVAPVAAAMLLVAAAAAPALAAAPLGDEALSGGVARLRENCECP